MYNNQSEIFPFHPNIDKRTYTVKCRVCGRVHHLSLHPSDVNEFIHSSSRRHIQDIFYYLKPELRELLITGICPDCFPKPPKEE